MRLCQRCFSGFLLALCTLWVMACTSLVQTGSPTPTLVSQAATTNKADLTPAATETAAPPTPAPAVAISATLPTVQEYPVPTGSGPHDVAPAADGGIWFTAQAAGQLGWLNPTTGAT